MTVWENFMKILETIRYASPEDEKEQSEELIVKKRDNDNVGASALVIRIGACCKEEW